MAGQAQPLSSSQTQKRLIFPPSFDAGAVVKRTFDILVALLGLFLLSPIFFLLAIWIKRDEPGPVFYKGSRAAKNGGIFSILKFRTMYENDQSYAGLKVTAEGDERITPLGKWLRDTKLNELPQLWNVLKGDMSLVGPRPEDPEIADEWPEKIRKEILSVRPGITSPASVLYRDEENLLQGDQIMDTYLNTIAPNKQRLDQLYVRNQSFWLDLDVLLWTFWALIPQVSQYKPPESMLFVGPITRFVSRYLSWFGIDALISFIAIGLSALIWRSFGPLNVGWNLAILASIGYAFLFSACGAIFGIQRIIWRNARGEDAVDLIPPVILATGLAIIFNHLILGEHAFPAGILLLSSIFALVGFIIGRYRRRIFQSLGSRIQRSQSSIAKAAGERLLIIGGGEAGQFAAWLLNDQPAYNVIGFVDDDLFKLGSRISRLPVLGSIDDLPMLVKEHDIGIVVFAIHKINSIDQRDLLNTCEQSGAQVLMFPDFLSVLNTTIRMNGKTPKNITDPFVSSWPGIAPAQVSQWLRNIDQSLAEYGIDAAQEQIKRLQNRLNHSNKTD